MVPNKLGYMILISIPIQHPTQYYQPLVGYIIVLLSFPTHYRTYVWHTTRLMSIPMLYSILIHPFLLLPSPKCLLVHQFCRDWPVNWFLISFVVYLLLINSFVTSNVTELCLWVSEQNIQNLLEKGSWWILCLNCLFGHNLCHIG